MKLAKGQQKSGKSEVHCQGQRHYFKKLNTEDFKTFRARHPTLQIDISSVEQHHMTFDPRYPPVNVGV